MINSVTHTGTSLNPGNYMRLQLDPGEPGIERRVNASNATIAITSQEIQNIHRLRKAAFQDGRKILSAGIRYSASFIGGRLVITGGETTVTSVPGGPSPTNPPVTSGEPPGKTENGFAESTLETESSTSASGTSPSVDPVARKEQSGSIRELERELLQLQGEKTRLENKAEKSARENRDEAESPGYSEETANRLMFGNSKEELDRVETEIKKLRLEKIVEQLKRLQENLTEFGSANVSIATRYLKSRYPASPYHGPPATSYSGRFFDCLT